MYLDSCKDLVKTREDIRWAEGRKRKLEEELEEVNGQLFVMYKCSTVKEGGPFSSITRPFPPYGRKPRGYSGKLGNTLGNYVTMLL